MRAAYLPDTIEEQQNPPSSTINPVSLQRYPYVSVLSLSDRRQEYSPGDVDR